MNLTAAAICLAIFWALGVHHYLKHRELTGLRRFMQYKDVAKAWWYLIKSHEGIQTITLIAAAIFMVN